MTLLEVPLLFLPLSSYVAVARIASFRCRSAAVENAELGHLDAMAPPVKCKRRTACGG